MTTYRHLKVRWGDLGSPTAPCVVDYWGNLIDVKQTNIDAAEGNPDAIFTATEYWPVSGRTRFLLGAVEFSEE